MFNRTPETVRAIRNLYAAKTAATVNRHIDTLAAAWGIDPDAIRAAYTVTRDAETAAAFRDAFMDELTAPAAETAPAVTRDPFATAVQSMRNRLRVVAAVHEYPLATAAQLANRAAHMRNDEIAAAAFRDVAAMVGLEDLTDANPVIERGRQYQRATVVLTRGRGKNAPVLESVHIPATRGRVNVCAWYSAIAGHEVTPVECPAAFVECDATHKTARKYRAANGDVVAVVKTSKGGVPIPRKMGIQAFIRDVLAPVMAAHVWNATDTGRYHIGYHDGGNNAHVVSF